MKRGSCGLGLIERGILHLKRGSCGLWLIERGMLHLKHVCFGLWLTERGMLHLKHTCYKTILLRTYFENIVLLHSPCFAFKLLGQ